MKTISLIAFLAATVVSAILYLRKENGRTIYILWYVFSLSFVLFYGLSLLSRSRGLDIAEYCGAYKEACTSALMAFVDISDELSLLAVLAAVVVGPQLMTYLLAGLSGSASPPKFVSHFSKFVALSLIKFSATVAGAEAGFWFSSLTLGDASGILVVIGSVTLYLSFAFVLAAVDAFLSEHLPKLFDHASKKSFLQPLINLHNFCTRNNSKQ